MHRGLLLIVLLSLDNIHWNLIHTLPRWELAQGITLRDIISWWRKFWFSLLIMNTCLAYAETHTLRWQLLSLLLNFHFKGGISSREGHQSSSPFYLALWNRSSETKIWRGRKKEAIFMVWEINHTEDTVLLQMKALVSPRSLFCLSRLKKQLAEC